MKISEAFTIATRHISTNFPYASAAFVGGSSASAPPESELASDQDVDVYVLIEQEPPPGKIGKVRIDGALLDISWLNREVFEHALDADDAVMTSLLQFGLVIHDPEGWLIPRQAEVRSRFATTSSIAARLASMRAKIRDGLARDSSHLSPAEQVMNWLFPSTLATHLPLIAALRPLTVRKRFVAAKAVMPANAYEELLSLYGFQSITPHQAQTWLDETADILDATREHAERSERFWATDLLAPEIAIGGSQELINTGLYREALFWIIATRARCLVLFHDEGINPSTFSAALARMLSTMNLESPEKRAARSLAIIDWVDRWSAY